MSCLCVCSKFSSRPKAIMDTKLFALDLTFDTTFDQDKADRLRYGQSLMTHAMVFTGVDVKDDKIKKWWVTGHSRRWMSVLTCASVQACAELVG